jgi:uroporphyrin-III C-methyltransferase
VSGGVVYLVGAGPGDPRLLTLRGAEVLQRADVVVHDRLAPAALLDLAPRGAERVDAGKARGHAAISQEGINRLLVDRARRGLAVVRLKGGDPFVFGRGGEEALALAAAAVPFEVVPGVSAAVAAPAYAGIPLTHRGLAASVAVVSASLAGGPADLARVATAVDTLVVLMVAERLGEVCAGLIAAGRPGDHHRPALAGRHPGRARRGRGGPARHPGHRPGGRPRGHAGLVRSRRPRPGAAAAVGAAGRRGPDGPADPLALG